MDLNKYSELREKVYSQDFEDKYKDVNKWLTIFSYFGNIGSIFFAFFLVYPALYKAISANIVEGNISIYLSGFATVLILSAFELLKRKVLANLSLDLVKSNFNIKASIVGWLLFSLSFIGASFYFSLNGAMNFASTSQEKNNVVVVSVDNEIDSLNTTYADYTKVFEEENNELRSSNKDLRDKISETPLNYRTVRKELQQLIDANNETIEANDNKIESLKIELGDKIAELEKESNEEQEKNQNDDLSNIYLFLIISTSIEVIIILGVFFQKYYIYNIFKSNISEMEELYRKRDRYKTLLRFVYKKGLVRVGEPVMGKTKIIELIKEKSDMISPNKFVDDFFTQMEYMGIIEMNGKRRVIKISYDEALEKIENFDDILKLLEKLD
jgi:hypothetical protein